MVARPTIITARDAFRTGGLGSAPPRDFGDFRDYCVRFSRRTGTDVGWGVRLGPRRSTDTDAVISIDLARRFETDVQPAGWAVVVRRGVRF